MLQILLFIFKWVVRLHPIIMLTPGKNSFAEIKTKLHFMCWLIGMNSDLCAYFFLQIICFHTNHIAQIYTNLLSQACSSFIFSWDQRSGLYLEYLCVCVCVCVCARASSKNSFQVYLWTYTNLPLQESNRFSWKLARAEWVMAESRSFKMQNVMRNGNTITSSLYRLQIIYLLSRFLCNSYCTLSLVSVCSPCGYSFL